MKGMRRLGKKEREKGLFEQYKNKSIANETQEVVRVLL
jgi:hypothetical protein